MLADVEWLDDGDWRQGVIDPNALITEHCHVTASMADRYKRCGCIETGGYWSEPALGLALVQEYLSDVELCKARLLERTKNG